MNRRVRIGAMLLCCFLASVSGLSCGGKEAGIISDGDTSVSFLVKTITVRKTEMAPELSSFGTITFFSKTDVSVPVEGIITSIYAEEGDRVAKGTLLAELENTQLQVRGMKAETSVTQARAGVSLTEVNYRKGLLQTDARVLSIEKIELALLQKNMEVESLKKDLARREELFKVDGVPEDQVEKLKLSLKAALTDYENTVKDLEILRIGFRDEDIRTLGYTVPRTEVLRRALFREINCLPLKAEEEAARAGLEAAERELESVNMLIEELRIHAPGDGVLGARYAEAGERLASGVRLFTIFREDKVYAVFPVREKDGHLVREGQEAFVVVPALPDAERTARVTIISPMLDPQTGNVMVKGVMENPDGRLKPGMFVRVRLVLGAPRNRIHIPVTCLLAHNGEKKEVFVYAAGRVFRRAVFAGGESEGFVEIVSGLTEGELVVDSPSPRLEEGAHAIVQ